MLLHLLFALQGLYVRLICAGHRIARRSHPVKLPLWFHVLQLIEYRYQSDRVAGFQMAVETGVVGAIPIFFLPADQLR